MPFTTKLAQPFLDSISLSHVYFAKNVSKSSSSPPSAPSAKSAARFAASVVARLADLLTCDKGELLVTDKGELLLPFRYDAMNRRSNSDKGVESDPFPHGDDAFCSFGVPDESYRLLACWVLLPSETESVGVLDVISSSSLPLVSPPPIVLGDVVHTLSSSSKSNPVC